MIFGRKQRVGVSRSLSLPPADASDSTWCRTRPPEVPGAPGQPPRPARRLLQLHRGQPRPRQPRGCFRQPLRLRGHGGAAATRGLQRRHRHDADRYLTGLGNGGRARHPAAPGPGHGRPGCRAQLANDTAGRSDKLRPDHVDPSVTGTVADDGSVSELWATFGATATDFRDVRSALGAGDLHPGPGRLEDVNGRPLADGPLTLPPDARRRRQPVGRLRPRLHPGHHPPALEFGLDPTFDSLPARQPDAASTPSPWPAAPRPTRP
jgi:hypothetical protein